MSLVQFPSSKVCAEWHTAAQHSGRLCLWRRGVKKILQNQPQATMRRAHPIIRSLAHIPFSAGFISPGTLQHHSKDRQAGNGDKWETSQENGTFKNKSSC